MILHAGCVARQVAGRWRGVLLTGPSGVGKSDLTLRLLAGGWTLVADDRALAWSHAGRLYARAPEALTGLIEARGLGVLPAVHRAFAGLDLLVECVGAEGERTPVRGAREIAGVALEVVEIQPLAASAPAKLERAFARALRGF